MCRAIRIRRDVLGFGLATPPGGVAVTCSDDSVTKGWNEQFTACFIVCYAVGVDKNGDWFDEFGVGTPGFSWTAYYVYSGD